jgi:hypothetical protein
MLCGDVENRESGILMCDTCEECTENSGND